MLNLPTLEARRQALKICYLYKLIHDLVFYQIVIFTTENVNKI